jgi:hypothetical protein
MVRHVRKRKRVTPEARTRCEAWISFAKRAVILLGAVFLAAGLISVVGWEAVSATGIVKEAASALAEAAADAFGDAG